MNSLPHSEDAEKGLLASAIIDVDAAVGICAKLLPVMLYIPSHEVLFHAIKALVNNGVKLDFISLVEEMGERGLEECGGKEWISELMGFVPSGKNWEHYLSIVVEKYNLRQIILNAQIAISSAEAGDLRGARSALNVQAEAPETDDVLSSGHDIMEDLATYLQREEAEGESFPVAVEALKSIVPKLYPGQLILIGGKRGACKTGLAVSMVAFGIEHARQDPNFFHRNDEEGDISPPTFHYREDPSDETDRSDID
jgi:replicative DNA helicase